MSHSRTLTHKTMEPNLQIIDRQFATTRLCEYRVLGGHVVLGECFHRHATLLLHCRGGEGCLHSVNVNQDGHEEGPPEAVRLAKDSLIEIPRFRAYMVHAGEGMHLRAFYTTVLPNWDVIHHEFKQKR